MAPQTFLLTSSSLLMLVSFQYFIQTSHANCTPSACGIIRNISYPFRLKNDPTNCGGRPIELPCENNVTSIYLNSHRYFVKAINYGNFDPTIRLVDASLNNDDTCSFPNSSTYLNYPYLYLIENEWINFMSCPHPLKNSSSFLTDITHCASDYSSITRFTYIVGDIPVSEIPQSCEVEMRVMTSWKFKDSSNVSLSEIHKALLYGNELHFFNVATSEYEKLVHLFFGRLRGLPFILLGILVLVSAGVSLPVMIIIGFTGLFGILTYTASKLFNPLLPLLHRNIVVLTELLFIDVRMIINIITSLGLEVGVLLRFIICPFIAWLLIYKFRRRHLSVFQTIENFLQSDNNLTPIRYSYSDIKKMTKGFQHKLGEGGYGCVYKGKLRSGNDVAVKLLGKSGANGKDFINEIATIGRIHHVNIVKLVGYCAQGSKRALVFDFMPNGSLEKYLFNPEKMKSLNLVTKFEIAVGVARGIGYLHRGCDIQILHFDIKPHNILLDDKFIPKISDFGLAKFHSANKNTVTLTAARGTIGYVAPELISRSIGVVSHKADVYSFGMVLIEMVNIKRDEIGNNGDSSQYFPCWIYDHLARDKGFKVTNIDENENYDDNHGEWKLARKMTIVALWCIQMNPDDLPSMNKVVEMLEGDVENLRIPNHPTTQSSDIVANEAETWDTCSTDSTSLLYNDDASIVEITIAE